ncbi:MAG TPA: HEAT repeat domain-containing protein [Pyrinomonadaceae bacterium]|jgi:biotin carboxyl carrier protein|nr:HEAT repeat domain-containing protein [Pyrinomonadaceae bacterium]
MDGQNSNHHPLPATPPDDKQLRRRTPWPLAVVAVLFVVVPFIAWYGSWFGRALSDEQIEEYLQDAGRPRRVQHALSEIERRIAAHDGGVRRWYPQIVTTAANPHADIRLTAAWVMGADTRAAEFHEPLLRLLSDAEPSVRRNAALSLVSFGDARSRAELRAMLRPYTVRARSAGTALTALTEGSQVRRDSMLVRFETEPNVTGELRSPLDGKIERAFIKTGDRFENEQELFVLAADAVTVGNALVALGRVGEPDDLTDVEAFARGVEGMPEYVKKQAALTAEAIKRRAAENQK